MKFIEPLQTEWVRIIVFVPKKDAALLFCVDYSKNNAVASRDSNLLLQMDKCIDFLWVAEMFFTLHANVDYWQIELYKIDREKSALTSKHVLKQLTNMPIDVTSRLQRYSLWASYRSQSGDIMIFYVWMRSSYSQELHRSTSSTQKRLMALQGCRCNPQTSESCFLHNYNWLFRQYHLV